MRAALLSFHSHSDRSFLDDRDLAVVSGELRSLGLDNDLFVTVLDARTGRTAGEANDVVLARLAAALAAYDVIVFERIWSTDLIDDLRARLAGKVFVCCEGEHPLDHPPADYVVGRPSADALLALRTHLEAGAGGALPAGVARPGAAPGPPVGAGARPFAPNVTPVMINAHALPAFRPFTVLGNEGCPYQADARDNPIYAGVSIPDAYGRGCAFCATGNYSRRSPDVLESVLEQLVYLDAHLDAKGDAKGPQRRHVVLKDQNPFVYLTELLDACAERGLRPFTLLLETRADWFLRNEARFARALDVSREQGYQISPYLVGIESFSQAELDRFNKGISAETNVEFLAALWRWKDEYGPALDLGHASFGFVLFTPWTTLDDLAINCEAIAATRFDELRGRILTSRARLYRDNALYYLAERDRLLVEDYRSAGEDNAARYGYLPAQPWRFAHPAVARFSDLATELSEATGGRDEVALFRALLACFAEAEAEDGGDGRSITAAEVRERIGRPVAPAEMIERLRQMTRPLDLERGFAGGWRLGTATLAERSLRLRFCHPDDEPLDLSLSTSRGGAGFADSRHYRITHLNGDLSAAQRVALKAFCDAVVANDR